MNWLALHPLDLVVVFSGGLLDLLDILLNSSHPMIHALGIIDRAGARAQ